MTNIHTTKQTTTQNITPLTAQTIQTDTTTLTITTQQTNTQQAARSLWTVWGIAAIVVTTSLAVLGKTVFIKFQNISTRMYH